MDTDKITELVIKFTAELSTLNANMKQVLEKLTNHENRLMRLEMSKTSMKDSIVKWLVICLIASLGVIATLTGSTAIITKLLSVLS